MRTRADMNDIHLHYFLRPDHLDAGRIWAAASSLTRPLIEFEDRRVWLFDVIENWHDQGARTYCALDAMNGHMRGFVTIDPLSKRLLQIVVAPEALGSGLAKTLLLKARSAAPARMDVIVARDNLRALRFFEREGFRPMGPAQDIVTGDPAIILEWRA
jgi:putative acetyltransferase